MMAVLIAGLEGSATGSIAVPPAYVVQVCVGPSVPTAVSLCRVRDVQRTTRYVITLAYCWERARQAPASRADCFLLLCRELVDPGWLHRFVGPCPAPVSAAAGPM